MNKLNRYPITIDNGIFLCNDGTMWARKNGLVEVGTSEWIQLENVPQDEEVEKHSWIRDYEKTAFKITTRNGNKEWITLSVSGSNGVARERF